MVNRASTAFAKLDVLARNENLRSISRSTDPDRLKDAPTVIPELSLSTVPRHLWTGAKAAMAVAVLVVAADRSLDPSLDHQAMARLSVGKPPMFDPVTTGSVMPRGRPGNGRKP
jgi:hypothetical protein